MKSINTIQSTVPNLLCTSTKDQRGVVLFVALIVLVAMSLAGISMMRAVGTGTQVAGNLAFRQSAIQAPELAFENGLAQIVAMVNVGTSNQPGAAVGYSNLDVAQAIGQRSWANSQDHGTNALTGNRVETMTDRLCTQISITDTDCEVTLGLRINTDGNSFGNPNLPPAARFQHFRTIARVTDPKGKATLVEFKND